jgi:YbbR domain-containing protein
MSVLIAISLWIYVVAEENIFQERTFTADVQYVNLEESLTPSAKMPTVNISIRGDQIAINNLKVSDFSVSVDLKDANMGENEYPVIVEAPPGVKVVSISPQSVFLNIDERGEKPVPLKVNLSGKAKEGFTAFEPSLKTTHVTVSGPLEMINSINSAEVDVNLDNAESNLSLKLIPRIKEGSSGIVDEDIIIIKPELVDIFIPVIEDNPSKSVPLWLSWKRFGIMFLTNFPSTI